MTQSNLYHYTGCGLPNVWLQNGYQVEKNDYGEFVRIMNSEGLHKSIALALVHKPSQLSGAEFRFLRRELDMSQRRIGELFGRDRQSIANWEKEVVPAPFDFLIRHIYQEHLDRNAMYLELVDRLNDMDRQEFDGLKFATTDEGWKKTA